MPDPTPLEQPGANPVRSTGEPWPWLVAVAILPLLAASVRALGRPWWCACGSPVPWSWDTASSHNSQHLIDAYSFTHILHGLLFYGLLAWVVPRLSRMWRLVIAVGMEAVWEIFENTRFIVDRYRETNIAMGYYGDSALNAVSDTLFAALGFALAWRLGFRGSLVLFVVIEAVLLLWIRDSFLLNVVMLIHPFDAINAWQTGQ